MRRLELEKKLTKTQKKDAIYGELQKQLKSKGAATTVFESLIDDYIRYWEMKEKLKAEIKRNGMTYLDRFGEPKPSPALKEIQNISKLMLSILKEMDLKTGNVSGEEDAL